MSSFPWPGNSPREWNETIDKLISEDQPNVLNEKGQTPLWLVATYGFPGCVQKLVTTDKVNVNFQDELGRTPLYQASKSGHIDVVRVLLKHNADPNIWRNNGLAPIYQAVKNDHIQVVELLLDHKCQIPVQGHISIWRVAEGHTRDWLLQRFIGLGERANMRRQFPSLVFRDHFSGCQDDGIKALLKILMNW